jgi:hypothetical protein
MIMLGPGGTTAFDLWVCGERFRLAVPAADLVVRGDADTPPVALRHLPIGFLRWWFLAPMSGRLLSFAPEDAAGWWRFVLRDGEAIIDIRGQGDIDQPRALHVRRRVHREVQEIRTDGKACGSVHYLQRPSGIVLEVHCEARVAASPPPRAFSDPERPSEACSVLAASGDRDG